MQRVMLLSIVVLIGTSFTAHAYSAGPPQNDVVSGDGCTCHGSGSPNADTKITVSGVPATYQPNQRYHVNVSSETNVVNIGVNKGGFLVFASKGTFEKRSGSQDWYLLVNLSNNTKAIEHNKDGDTQNTAASQPWWFIWKAPAAGSGPANIRVYVNRVDGGETPNTADEWNRKHFTVKETSATSVPVAPPPGPVPPPAPPPAQAAPSKDEGLSSIGFMAVVATLAVVGVSLRRD